MPRSQERPLPDLKIDGVSLLTILKNESDSPVREALCLYYHDNSLEAITDGTFKLLFPHHYFSYGLPGNDGMPGRREVTWMHEKELYGLRADPGESIYVITQHPERVKKLDSIARR